MAELRASRDVNVGLPPRASDATPRRLATGVAAVILVAALAVAAWVATRPAAVGSTIDGFPVGDVIACDATQECDAWIQLARAALDKRDPGHASVVGATVHSEDFQNTEVYPDQSALRSRTVGFVIVVFRLADGSASATGLYCPPGGCTSVGTYPH